MPQVTHICITSDQKVVYGLYNPVLHPRSSTYIAEDYCVLVYDEGRPAFESVLNNSWVGASGGFRGTVVPLNTDPIEEVV